MIFSFLRQVVSQVNAWQIRMIALACLVLFVGGGSQALVNAFAASTPQPALPTQVVTLPHDDTQAGVQESCHIVVRRSTTGITIVSSPYHYAFVLNCTPKSHQDTRKGMLLQ